MEIKEKENVFVTEEVTLENVCIKLADHVYHTGKAVARLTYEKSDPTTMSIDNDALDFYDDDSVCRKIYAYTDAYYEYTDYFGNFKRRNIGDISKYLRGKLKNKLGLPDFVRCNETGLYYSKQYMELIDGKFYLSQVCKITEFGTYLLKDIIQAGYRDADGNLYYDFPTSMLEDAKYCQCCGNYIHTGWWAEEEETCRTCVIHRYDYVIEPYGASHNHNDDPIFFGEYKDVFSGLGFELEVETSEENSKKEGKIAYNLIPECDFSDNELHYAHDGSLQNGFEIISEPHTVKDFWSKTDKWVAMLDYMRRNGYTSHKSGRCGLHVHVSRTMFGNTKEEQNRAVAKLLSFYDDNFDALQTISRRRDLEYCDKNYANSIDKKYIRKGVPEKYAQYKRAVDNHNSGVNSHYCAINNSNRNTVEFRLGRGTLNPLSFLAWIDLCLTLTKNARRITFAKLASNDIVSWLAGIKKETARYCLSRDNSFSDAIYELYPEFKWDTSNEVED